MPAPLPHPEELQPVRGYRRPARTHGNQRITTLAASLIARSCSYARESAAGSHRGAPRPDVQPAHGNRWLTAAETQRLDRSDPYARESMRHRLMLAPDDVARPVRPGISGSGSPARCRPARTRGNRRRMDSRGIPRAASGPYARESAGKRRGPPLPNDVRPRTRGNQRGKSPSGAGQRGPARTCGNRRTVCAQAGCESSSAHTRGNRRWMGGGLAAILLSNPCARESADGDGEVLAEPHGPARARGNQRHTGQHPLDQAGSSPCARESTGGARGDRCSEGRSVRTGINERP